MKKINIPLAISVVLLMACACNDFLDRQPITNITPEKYFKSADELAAYTINYYETFFSSYRSNYNVGEIGRAHVELSHDRQSRLAAWGG